MSKIITRRRLRVLIAGVAVASLALFSMSAAFATTTATNNYVITTNNCSQAYAVVDPGMGYWGANQAWRAHDCVNLNGTWPANYQAVDGTLYDAPYPSAHVCANSSNHPTSSGGTDTVVSGYGIPFTCTSLYLYGCYWVASSSSAWIYIGFPPSWQNGSTITSFTAWVC